MPRNEHLLLASEDEHHKTRFRAKKGQAMMLKGLSKNFLVLRKQGF